MKCRECKRSFRNRAAYELYQRRLAVIESLRNATPCAHLATLVSEPAQDKRDRHATRSESFRQTGSLQ